MNYQAEKYFRHKVDFYEVINCVENFSYDLRVWKD